MFLGAAYLVGGLVAMFYFPIYWECHHPNRRSHIFQRGGPTTNQLMVSSGAWDEPAPASTSQHQAKWRAVSWDRNWARPGKRPVLTSGRSKSTWIGDGSIWCVPSKLQKNCIDMSRLEIRIWLSMIYGFGGLEENWHVPICFRWKTSLSPRPLVPVTDTTSRNGNH